MRYMQDYWKRGLGSPGIMLTDHGMTLETGSVERQRWEEFDIIIRRELNAQENAAAFKRLAVAILNTDVEETGQLFEIDADGKVIESVVIVPALRELLSMFMTR